MHHAVDRNGQRLFRTNQAVKGGAKRRRLRRSATLDSLICSERFTAVAIDGFL
jgi:hypothetical protein